MGRRVSKKVYSGSEFAWTLEKQTTFTYDGWNLIQEIEASVYDSSNSAFTQFRTSNYTWGLDLSQTIQGAGGVSGLLSLDKGTATYYYTYDANGNVSELIDTAGVVKAHYEYSPFGKVVYKSGLMKDENPFQFSTKYLDNETQLYYYGYRYYNPENGRWINRDPIAEHGGVNIYGFARNRSVFVVDTNGLGIFSDIRDWWKKQKWGPTPGGTINGIVAVVEETDGVEEGAYAKVIDWKNDSPSYFDSLFVEISAEVQVGGIIAAGPTPIPGTGWVISWSASGKVFCCQGESGVENWGEVSLAITAKIIAGGAFKGLKPSKNPKRKGSKYRKQKGGRYAKGPKKGDQSQEGTIAVGELKPCPTRGVSGTVNGFISGAAGIYWGVEGKLTFPIYPEFKTPSFNWTEKTGITGATLEAGATGKLSVTGPVGEAFQIF